MELRVLVETGTIHDGTQVWTEGMVEWQDFGQCKTLFGFDASTAPSAPVYTSLQYAVSEGECSAEVTLEEIKALLANETITATTQVWSNGMDAWCDWGQVKHLFGIGGTPEKVSAPATRYTELQYETSSGDPGWGRRWAPIGQL